MASPDPAKDKENYTNILPSYLEDEPPFELPDEPCELDEEMPIIIVPRSAWSTRGPTSVAPFSFPIKTIKFASKDIYSFDELFSKGMKKMEEFDMDQMKYSDVTFNFLVDEGGLIYEGRGWKSVPWYTERKKIPVLEIAFVGAYLQKFEMPSYEKCDAAHSLLMHGVRQNMVDPKFNIIGMKERAQFSEYELKWFPTHDTDYAPDPLPYNH